MTTMTGKQALLETLIAEGVEHVFGNPGTTEGPFMDALQDYPQIRYILGLQETPVVTMADGYARASGKVGFVNVHIAAGLANSMSGLYNAYRGGTPLVITAGQSDTRLLQEEPAISADLVRMTRQFTKWSTEVLHAADTPMVVRRAFKVAMNPPTGPVFLSLPWDVLDATAEVDLRPPPPAYHRARPDREGVEKAAELLAGAANPVVLVGDRLAQSGGMAELVRLAELLGAPVYAANRSEPVFPTDHPLFAGGVGPWGSAGREALARADVALAVGANLFNPFLYAPRDVFTPSTRLIHLDSSAWEIGRVYAAEVGMVADPKAGLNDLIDELGPRLGPERRAAARARLDAAAKESAAKRDAFEREARARWDAVPISPERLALELREVYPQNAILIDEGITTSGPIHNAIKFREPGAFYSIRGGAIGGGMGGALGVQLARPDRRVIAVIGDGSAGYSFQALWTAAHYRLPVKYVICNNRSYRVLKVNMVRYLGEASRRSRFIGMDIRDPEVDFAKLAEGFGVRGWRVERPGELRPTLEAALSHDGPALVDVVLDGSYEGHF